jgi:hypothetical protein
MPGVAGAKASRAQLATALAQRQAGQVLSEDQDRFLAGYQGQAELYGASPALKALPCDRLRTKHRRSEVEYRFHCSMAIFQICVFVAPDFSYRYDCGNPQPYRLANEDRLSEAAGFYVRVYPWWYDEMPAMAFESAGNGFLHPWCTGPGGVTISIEDRRIEAGQRKGERRLELGPAFTSVPDSARPPPWRCPLGPFEPVNG